MSSMKALASALSFLLLAALDLAAQDLKVRQEAATLLEHAHAVSTPASQGPYRLTVKFRAFFPDGKTDEGTYARMVGAPGVYREEMESTDAHFIGVYNGNQVARVKSREVVPAVETKVLKLVPIYLVRFDHADVIRSITETGSNGRPARCIEFDTTYGEKTWPNEICVDKELGTVVHMRVQDETLDYSSFFPYRQAWYPGHIAYEQNGVSIEMEQTMREIPGLDPADLTPPPGAEEGTMCREYRRPFGVFMPQPKAGNGSHVTDIVIHGVVRADGKLYGPTIDSSSRPDLNEEALAIARTWTFTPPTCNGQTTYGPMVITLHFQGR